MVEYKWLNGSDELDGIMKLRYDVFCREQGYPASLEQDSDEMRSLHLEALDDGKLIGCGRLTQQDESTYHIGRIALYPEYRGGGNGTGIVRELLSKARKLGARQVTLSAQTHALGFYKKLGFVPDSAEFMDENIPHINMVKSLVFADAEWQRAPEELDAVFMRKSFTADKNKIVSARVTYTTLGFSQPFVNGKRLTEYKFIPAWSNYQNRDTSGCDYPIYDEMRARIYYLTFDITDFIADGENIFCLHIGNGWYRQRDQHAEGIPVYGSALEYVYKIELVLSDGSRREIVSGSGEKLYKSYITHSNIYLNETVDASLYSDKITCPGFVPHGALEPQSADAPESVLTEQTFAGDSVKQRYISKLIHTDGNVKLYDLGANISGIPEFNFDSARNGDEITVEYAEVIDSGFNFKLRHTGGENRFQRDKFIYFNNDCPMTNAFTWRAGQFVRVTGNAELRAFYAVNSDIKNTSEFTSSDETLNWLYNAYINTQSNNIHSFVPSDCPHRERLGYTGDGQLCAPAVMTMYDAKPLYIKWMQDIADCQDTYSGHVQHTAPFAGGGGGPGGWGGAIVTLPYNFYKFYGDTSLAEKYFDAMKSYLDYMDSHSEFGLVVRGEPKGWCLGDWCAPDNRNELPEPFINTYFLIKCLKMYIELSYIIDRPRYRETMTERLQNASKAFKNAYFSSNTHSFCGGIQGADALAYDIGLADDKTLDNLKRRYEKLGEFDSGIFGTPAVIKALFDSGNADTAVKLLTSHGENSYYNMKKNGATTLWENWDGCDSHSHPMFGAVCEYLFKYLLGIKQTDDSSGYKKLSVSPAYVKGLDVSGSMLTPMGRVSVSVSYDGDIQHVKYTVADTVEII